MSSISCPVAILVIVIPAPMTTAPEGSLTVPTMLPVPTVVWANKTGARLNKAKTAESRKAMMHAGFPAAALIR